MNRDFFISRGNKHPFRILTACFLILIACGSLAAQYKGAPVQKDRLVRALRSKQLQTRHIIAIINSNGVDFQLTPEIQKELIEAGARPAVINAVINNSRATLASDSIVIPIGDDKTEKEKTASPAPAAAAAAPSYDELIDQAMQFHKQMNKPNEAMRVLKEAARMEPENPMAYQMIAYVYLYGLNDFAHAEKTMRDSIRLGGSAVFRVRHDEGDGKFTQTCEGSLYISRDGVRFESDDNQHTFETPKTEIDEIKIDSLSTPGIGKQSVYKIIVRSGKDHAKFRFAPLTGNKQESRMVERLVRWNGNSPNQNRRGEAIKPGAGGI